MRKISFIFLIMIAMVLSSCSSPQESSPPPETQKAKTLKEKVKKPAPDPSIIPWPEDNLEPDEIVFMEKEYLDANGNSLKKPSPIYKDGLKLYDGSTINLKEGWKFVHISVKYQNLEDTKLSIDLNQILVESDNGPITCSAYGPTGIFFPYVHGRTSEGSFAPKSNTYFYTKFEWKNNVVTYSGLRRKLVFFDILFAVPNSLDMKTISWYGKPLTERYQKI